MRSCPYRGADVLRVAEEKGYLIPDFSWDNLAISKQNLTTPEWAAGELKALVERERVKTEIFVRMRRPVSWLGDLWRIFKRSPIRFPGKVYSRLHLSGALARICKRSNAPSGRHRRGGARPRSTSGAGPRPSADAQGALAAIGRPSKRSSRWYVPGRLPGSPPQVSTLPWISYPPLIQRVNA